MRKLLILSVSAVALGATGAMADEQGEILQNGSLGAAYIEQNAETASAFITQDVGSTSDTAAIVQDEYGTDGLSATITQNTFGTGFDNVAGVVQTNVDSGATSGSINQDGSSNTAGIRQRDVENSALIDQDGDENKAIVKQGDTPPGFAELEADNGNITSDVDFSSVLNFDGSSGGVFADGQNGPAQYSYGEVSQYGYSNRAAVLQVGESQYAYVSQDGDSNYARVQQAYELNSALVEQYGIENSADVLQDGSYNTADVLQDGYLNVATVTQHDTAGDEASIDQLGDENTGIVLQSNDEVVSVAIITQHGYGNIGFVNQ